MSLLLSRGRLLSRPVRACVHASTPKSFATLAEGAEGEEGEFSPDAEVKFESNEPTFMTTLTFSEQGIKAMIEKDIDREKSAAKLIGLLGGRLESYHVTTTGSSNAVIVYKFPKNHDVQTLIYSLMSSEAYKEQTTTKLMRWSDAAMSLRASRNLYAKGGVSCKIEG